MRAAWVVVGVLAGCGDDVREPKAPQSPVGPVPAYDQRTGDPQRGWDALINEGYVGCGVPLTAYRQVFDPAPPHVRLPGRSGVNAEMPFNMTAFTTASGVEVVTPNCLQCHAERMGGALVIGLGNHTTDYTFDYGSVAEAVGSFVTDPAERREWAKWASRMRAIAPYTMTATIGVNSADNLAAVLFAHRDPETLAWRDEPRMTLPPADVVVPVDVPPWWHMQKKNAMFYVGAGRGDHARIMMTASTLCVDSVEEAEAIDSYFPDVRAYLLSLKAPMWPYGIDQPKAARGRDVFAKSCAQCHGTYDDPETYPNLVVATAAVGTDPVLAQGAGQFADRYINWFNDSFFGQLSFLAPAPGYIAPPLDGIWATAPYLHNGSVPTLRALLDSSRRAKYFTRSYDSNDYDREAVGWRITELASGQFDPPAGVRASAIYDTTVLGYSNAGHTYGDSLRPDELDALIEYLKTL
jgi:mono/diheme cytochrome c family protein